MVDDKSDLARARKTDATAAEPTYDRIMQIATGFWASKVLLSAVELGVFNALAAGPLDASSLRLRLGIHERGARDFFDALVAQGLLLRGETRLYTNGAEAARFLVRGKPGYIGAIIEMFNSRLYGFWGSLTEALRTGEPQNEARSGGDLFGALQAEPARLEGFARAMTGQSLPIAEALAAAFPWHSAGTVIDIGSAEGCVPVQLALAHPHLKAGGFDLPAMGPIFARFVEGKGLSGRIGFHAGDFFRDDLPKADVLIMGLILHDWNLATKRMLIGKAYSALPQGGSLIVYEMLIDNERRAHLPGLLMSLNMLIETRGGFDFTAADCIAWMREAGFRDTRTVALTSACSAVIAMK